MTTPQPEPAAPPDAPMLRILPLPDIAYDLHEYLRPAERTRASFSPNHYRCLPMVAANSLGWTLFNPFAFTVMWKGGIGTDAVIVECEHPDWVSSWFGRATFTVSPGFVVETSPGVDLWVRPVPHFFKLPVMPMEGIVETDWLDAGFTLNYTLQLPLIKAHYAVGEPLVQFVPYPRHFIEDVQPEIVTSGPVYKARMKRYAQAQEKREAFTAARARSEDPRYHLDYLHGRSADGQTFEDHKLFFHPRPLADSPDPAPDDDTADG